MERFNTATSNVARVPQGLGSGDYSDEFGCLTMPEISAWMENGNIIIYKNGRSFTVPGNTFNIDGNDVYVDGNKVNLE